MLDLIDNSIKDKENIMKIKAVTSVTELRSGLYIKAFVNMICSRINLICWFTFKGGHYEK